MFRVPSARRFPLIDVSIMQRFIAAAALVLAAVSPTTAQTRAPDAAAEMVLVGGRVFLADRAGTVAQAVAVREGKVVAAGTDAQVRRWAGPRTQVVELGGKLVTPGFNDAHIHFAAGGASLLAV